MSTPHQLSQSGTPRPGSTNSCASSVPFSPDPLRVQQIPLELIDLDPRQSRCRVDEIAVQHLQQSIRDRGLLEPIRVRLSPAGDRFLAYIGGRRTRAYQSLREEDPERYATIPAFVDSKEDAEALTDSLAENIHRQDLSAVELGQALLALKELRNWTHKKVAEQFGFTDSYVRLLTSKSSQVLNSPVLAALDREKPLPPQLLLAVPSNPALHPRFDRTWREWGDRPLDPLCRMVRRWSTQNDVEDPHSLGGTRIERLRRIINDVRLLRSSDFWEAGPLTAGEAALLPNLEYQLRETLQVIERLTSEEAGPGQAH